MTAVLEHYRRCDALALVIGVYEEGGAAAAISGVTALLEELVLLGQITAERAAGRLEKQARMKTDKEIVAKHATLLKVIEQFEQGLPVRQMELSPEELNAPEGGTAPLFRELLSAEDPTALPGLAFVNQVALKTDGGDLVLARLFTVDGTGQGSGG